MMMTTTGFDERTLAALPEAPAGWVAKMRSDALESFLALPVPSQDTEEWRYTDLSGFELSFTPFATGGGPEAVNKHGVLRAAGITGERAGFQIQVNSEVVSTRCAAGALADGVIFGDLDLMSAAHPELVEPHLHSVVPADRSKFTALHAAFRTGGTFLYVPAGVSVALPFQTLSYLDVDGNGTWSAADKASISCSLVQPDFHSSAGFSKT